MAVARARREHIPAVVHVVEMTQPQGHSTGGWHGRYKSKERLRFEIEFEPIRRMRDWMLREELVDAATLDQYERADRDEVERSREQAFEAYQAPIRAERERALTVIEAAGQESAVDLAAIIAELRAAEEPTRRLVAATAARALAELRRSDGPARAELAAFVEEYRAENEQRFNSQLYSRSTDSPLRIGALPPRYEESAATVDGRIVLLRCFDANLARDPRIVILGEDVGKLGDVNLVFEGLQAKHAAPWRRSRDRHRGPLGLSGQGARARERRRAHGSARLPGDDPRWTGRHSCDVRRALPHRRGGRGGPRPDGHRDRDRRRADAPAVRPRARHRRIGPEDRCSARRRRGRSRR